VTKIDVTKIIVDAMNYWCVKQPEKSGKGKIGHSLKIKKLETPLISLTLTRT